MVDFCCVCGISEHHLRPSVHRREIWLDETSRQVRIEVFLERGSKQIQFHATIFRSCYLRRGSWHHACYLLIRSRLALDFNRSWRSPTLQRVAIPPDQHPGPQGRNPKKPCSNLNVFTFGLRKFELLVSARILITCLWLSLRMLVTWGWFSYFVVVPLDMFSSSLGKSWQFCALLLGFSKVTLSELCVCHMHSPLPRLCHARTLSHSAFQTGTQADHERSISVGLWRPKALWRLWCVQAAGHGQTAVELQAGLILCFPKQLGKTLAELKARIQANTKYSNCFFVECMTITRIFVHMCWGPTSHHFHKNRGWSSTQ